MPAPVRVKKSLRVSCLDGVFAACMLGLTADYITPYALALNANNRQIGILSAFPALAAALAQLHTAEMTDHLRSRRALVTRFVLFQVCVGAALAALPFLRLKGAVVWFIALVAIFNAAQALIGPAWLSLMGEYIPARMRGRYFGWRNKVLGAVTVSASFAAGGALLFFRHAPLFGFSLIFLAATLCRLFSWFFLTQMYEPPYRHDRAAYFSFLDFLRRARESNFARFVFFVAGLNFCVNIAAPFFSVFMLRELRFNYLTYTALVTAVTITQLLTIDRWGRHADRFGNLRVLRLTALIIASLPLWWLFNHNPFYLFFPQVLGGFAWAGFNLCAINFIYDAVTPQKRVRCLAYFSAISGVATCCGALAGAMLVTILPPLQGYRIFSLFVLSSALRFVTAGIFAGRIREVRHAEKVQGADLFLSVAGIRPLPLGTGRQPVP